MNHKSINKSKLSGRLKILFKSKNYVSIFVVESLLAGFLIIWKYNQFYFRDIGITYIQIGVLTSIYYIGNFIASIIGGYIADRYDRRKLYIFMLIFLSCGFLIYSLIENFMIAIVAYSVFALSNVFTFGSQTFTNDSMPKNVSGLGLLLLKIGDFFIIAILVWANFMY